MSISELERFVTDAEDSTDLKEELIKIGTAEESVVSFAKSKGYDFTTDELKAAVEKRQGALSDEELEKVAGGGHYEIQSAPI